LFRRDVFSDEHELFRTTVRRFVETEIMPFHAEWEAAGMVPKSAWKRAGELGLLCCNIPEEYGGVGGTFLYSVVIIEELARAGASGPAFPLHSDIVAPYLLKYGTEAQKRRWLPGMATGEAIAAVAMSEPASGSDLASIQTRAERDGDDYVITGQKIWITNAQNASFLVLAAKTDPKAGSRGISLILVETDRPGFARGRLLQKIGCKASDTSELFFDHVRVPVTNLLGTENKGFGHLMTELAQERLIQAVRAVSTAEAALRWTIEYTSTRPVFGRMLTEFQNTQFKLAELHADIVMQRVFTDRCIALHIDGQLDAVDAAIAKLQTSEMLGRVTDQCLQLFGACGYMAEYPIARAFVDARRERIAGGSVEIMKQIIARSILPQAAKKPAV
jgi:acyl-CoA dehydrogenase